MAEGLIVIGAGGFGREALDVATAINMLSVKEWEILGVMDDAPSSLNVDRLKARDVPYLGPANPQRLPSTTTSVAIAVGSPIARSSLWGRFADSVARIATLIHPRAEIGSKCRIGPGSVICVGVSVGTNVTLGRGVHLNPNVTIGHDTLLNDFVSVNPAATISGDCVIDGSVLVGSGSVVLQGLTVGSTAVIGAGSVVVRDVMKACTVKGVPAR
jgi:sugar O-acyltransferase (sialic acid O-acetyltransferase NeuD family)